MANMSYGMYVCIYLILLCLIDNLLSRQLNPCLLECQSDELLDHIKFDHGYTISSPPIINVCIHIHPLVALNWIMQFLHFHLCDTIFILKTSYYQS